MYRATVTLLVSALAWTAGCTEERVELLVDLRTDLVAGEEFERVHSELAPSGGSTGVGENEMGPHISAWFS
jgi:hypothetical protein